MIFNKWILLLSLVVSIEVKASGSEMSGFFKELRLWNTRWSRSWRCEFSFYTIPPGEQLNNISKGASLGLYFGIGYGLYKIYGTAEEKPGFDYQLSCSPWIIMGIHKLYPTLN